jgi:hypothetical protein
LRTHTNVVLEQGAEEDIWDKEEEIERKLENTAYEKLQGL